MFLDALYMLSQCRIGLPVIASALLAPSARPTKAFFTRGEIAVVVVYLLLGHILRNPKELLPRHDLHSIRRRLRMGKRKPRSLTETGFDLPQRHYHKPTGKRCQYESGSQNIVYRKTTTIDGKGALFFDPPNFKRPRKKRTSAFP